MRSVSDRNLAEQVADELRSAIHSGELAPGQRLVERQLSAQLGVSHIPVREALMRLAEERLVVREPRRGARVAELTQQDFEEISSLRIALEQFMVLRVQQRWSSTSAARLEAVVQAMEEAAVGDAETLLELDHEFHDTLADLADHNLLSAVSGQLRDRIAGFIGAANAAVHPENQSEHVQSHRILLDAIASGDVSVASEIVAKHIAQGLARLQDARMAAPESPSTP